MNYIDLLTAIPQFHQKLDELGVKTESNKAILLRLQSILDMLVQQVGDLTYRLNCQVGLKTLEKRMDAMLSDAGKAASPRPANA